MGDKNVVSLMEERGGELGQQEGQGTHKGGEGT